MDDYVKGDGMDTVDPPPGDDRTFVAVRVKGDSMYPAYQDGDVLYYSEKSHDLAAAHGKDCVIELEDGRVLVKRMDAQPKGITLHSHNAPPIHVDRIVWAAPVAWVKRR